MKKLKLFLPVLMAALMAFSIPFMTACKKPTENTDENPDNGKTDTGDDETNDKYPILLGLSVNSDNAKVEYFTGEQFDSTGLVVTATIQSSEAEIAEVKTLNSNEYVVDSSAFDNSKGGTYTINVSYTLGSETKNSSYVVTVLEYNFDGLKVSLADGVSETFNLTSENPTAEIDLSKIVVNEIEYSDGSVGDVITDFTSELYLGDTKIETTDGKATVSEGGIYQIWAYKESEVLSGYMRSGFVLIYVVDSVVSLELTSGTTEQVQGQDSISSTWNFKATYASGATKNLTYADVVIENLDTKTVGESTATVTYTEINAAGKETSVNTTVTYTINAAAEGTEITESFIAQRDLAAGSSCEAGSTIVTNSLFSLTSDTTLNYTNTTSNQLTVVLLDSTSTTFTSGLTAGTNAKDDAHTSQLNFTAKDDITLYIYIGFSSSSWNSNKPTTAYVTINGEAQQNVSFGDRKVYVELKYTLSAGDVLSVYGIMQPGYEGRMWLFGAEATNITNA